MKVLSFGSLNIDFTYLVSHFVQKGETISSRDLLVAPGGKGLNQSVALAKAGASVYHAGSIGPDGEFLIDILKDSGADVSNVKRLTEVRTGNALIQNDDEGDNCIILYGGANQAITKAQVDETFAKFEKGDYLILQNEINELKYIVEQAAEKGLKIVLNPSPMNEKILALPLEKVDYFLLNEIEAGQLVGKNDQPENLLDAMCKKFPNAAIVLTVGADGAWYAKGDEKVFQPAFKVKAVDTTAAGDTFTGYFVAGIMKGMEVKEAMALAAKASSITVTRQGAAKSIPRLEEVK